MKLKHFLYIIVLSSTVFISRAQNWVGINIQNMFSYPRILYTDTIANLLYIGGAFDYINGNDSLRGIASYDGTNFHPLGVGIDYSPIPGTTPNNVLAICRYHNDLYIGGGFLRAGNVTSHYIAKWDGNAWQMVGANGNINAMLVYNDELYVCGYFDTIAGVAARYVAKYNGINWTPISLPLNISDHVDAITFWNGELYAAGNFYSPGFTTIGFIKYNNTTGWQIVGPGLPNAWPWTTFVYNNELYVAGEIYASNGNPGGGIVRWDGTQYLSVGGGIEGIAYPKIENVTIVGNELWCTGLFNTAGGIPAYCIAKWDGTNWCGFGTTFDINHNAFLIGTYHNEIYLGGNFSTIDGNSILYIAKWIGGNYTDTCGNTTGVKEIRESNEFSIYPNPTTQTLHIQINIKLKSITITDITGREVLYFTNPDNTIDVSLLSKGLYFILGFDGERMVEAKFVKE